MGGARAGVMIAQRDPDNRRNRTAGGITSAGNGFAGKMLAESA
jgi:hypothetical protein